MARTIAAKATMYGGIKFRSRLEAKWAAYFDGVRLRWEYETKHHTIPIRNDETVYYTPDFWIPTLSTTLEVKPVPFGTLDEPSAALPDSEFHKVWAFWQIPAAYSPNHFYVTNGAPNFNQMRQGRQFYGFHGSDEWYDPLDIVCGPCSVCETVNIKGEGGHNKCVMCLKEFYLDERAVMRVCSQVKDMKFEDARD